MKQYRCGLIARDIHNSITPSVYEVYARDIGMEIDFSLFNIEPEQLKGQVDFCRAHLDGFNVTMPYKQKLLEFVDEADDSALKCGSTNTVLVREGRLIAYNTDGWGLMKALELFGVAIEGKRVVMLGAGGVALSIAYQLGLHGVKQVSVVNLFLDQAQSLCERLDSVSLLCHTPRRIYAAAVGTRICLSMLPWWGRSDTTTLFLWNF